MGPVHLYPITEKISPDLATPATLGGKGFGLYQMVQDGLPVPFAMILPTTACGQYKAEPKAFLKVLDGLVDTIISRFKDQNDGVMPLVSVRSGARVSMPGMMDTILNVGLDEDTFPYWAEQLGTDCAHNCDNRLIQMFANVVHGIPRDAFNVDDHKVDLLDTYNVMVGHPFPNAREQLKQAIIAVFDSWDNERAKTYRALNGIPDSWGTAVVIQQMVFGNRNDQSCTGVLFTRNPDTGEKGLTGEWLPNAQGEDVVAGTHTPRPLIEMAHWNPLVSEALIQLAEKLETSRRDVQDIEFTVENGKLYILQTRNAKRTSRAALKIAVDMHTDGQITRAEALERVRREDFLRAFEPVIDPTFVDEPNFTGIPACSGLAAGMVVLSSESAIACKEKGVPCVLVTKETTPDDIAGMAAAEGIVTMQGGSTSHAAVVARSMNKPAVVGVSLDINMNFDAGEVITIDGATGRIWKGKVPVVEPTSDRVMRKFVFLMQEEAKCMLIDVINAQFLDVSGLTPEGALVNIRHTLSTMKGNLVVDLTTGDRAPALTDFLALPDHEVLLTAYLNAHLTHGELERLTFLSELKLPKTMKRLPTVGTVPGLLDVHDKHFIFTGNPDHKATKRVLDWMAKDGQHPITVGTVQENGFASAFQLAEALLPQPQPL